MVRRAISRVKGEACHRTHTVNPMNTKAPAMNLPSVPYVDAAFPVRGETVPLDHGYRLFAALSRHLPALHERPNWGVHPIYGRRTGPGVLALTRRSYIKLRVPTDDVGHTIALAHKTIDVGGHELSLGIPRLFPLVPGPHLKSRIVTVKGFFDDADEFAAALARQLTDIVGADTPVAIARAGDKPGEPAPTPPTASIAEPAQPTQPTSGVALQLGPRRVIKASRSTVVGWAVALTGLDAHASLAIQQAGLGGRRHMGAGLFVPPGRGG